MMVVLLECDVCENMLSGPCMMSHWDAGGIVMQLYSVQYYNVCMVKRASIVLAAWWFIYMHGGGGGGSGRAPVAFSSFYWSATISPSAAWHRPC